MRLYIAILFALVCLCGIVSTHAKPDHKSALSKRGDGDSEDVRRLYFQLSSILTTSMKC